MSKNTLLAFSKLFILYCTWLHSLLSRNFIWAGENSTKESELLLFEILRNSNSNGNSNWCVFHTLFLPDLHDFYRPLSVVSLMADSVINDPSCAEDWLEIFMVTASVASTSERVFKAIVGTSIRTIHKLWKRYGVRMHIQTRVLLWLVSFLFQYPRNDITMAALWKVCNKTFFNAVWPTIFELHEIIDEVKFLNQIGNCIIIFLLSGQF